MAVASAPTPLQVATGRRVMQELPSTPKQELLEIDLVTTSRERVALTVGKRHFFLPRETDGTRRNSLSLVDKHNRAGDTDSRRCLSLRGGFVVSSVLHVTAARRRGRPHRSDQAAAATREKKRKQRSEQISGDNSPNGCELCEGCSQTPPAHGRYARRTAAA